MLASLIVPALLNGPEIINDGEEVFNDIVHGEGGVQKIEKVAGSLAKLFASLLGVATNAGALTPAVAAAAGNVVASVANGVQQLSQAADPKTEPANVSQTVG